MNSIERVMKFFIPLLPCLAIIAGISVSVSVPKQQTVLPPQEKPFQTTIWLNPVTLSPDSNTTIEPIYGHSGEPFSLQFFAPNGGSLRQILQTPTGYEIKWILLCSDQNRPIKGVHVQLFDHVSENSAITLPFLRMSNMAPGCAIYSLMHDGYDSDQLAAHALKTAMFDALRINLPPSGVPGEIEAVGVLLQAVKCEQPQKTANPNDENPQRCPESNGNGLPHARKSGNAVTKGAGRGDFS